jgi:hypothetical protein
MHRVVLALLVLCLFVPFSAVAQEDLIEAVSANYAAAHPGLASYQVRLKTDKIAEMITIMTANLPPDMVRPTEPELSKFWVRGNGFTIRANGPVMPTMQQMIARFSEQFSVELSAFLLPAEQQARRTALFKQAKTKSTDTVIGDERLHGVEIVFSKPTDLAGAFYGTSLGLPQRAVTRLVLDIDAQKRLLRQMVIETEGGARLIADIRHANLPGVPLPSEIRITSPDGHIDERFTTTFTEVAGFQLPARQERQIRRPDRTEAFTVEFFDYVLTTTTDKKAP